MIQVAYTNSNCEDLWEVFQKQTLKHSKLPLYLISDKIPHNFGFEGLSIYKNTEPYFEAWVRALKVFDYDYFIYMQEDFFLYADINQAKINEYEEFLRTHPEYSFVRLLKSGSLGNTKVTNTLYEIESGNPDIFSMQATIWRTKDYVALLEEVRDDMWLENQKYREAALKLKIKGVYHYDDENKRGGNHFDSTAYPYVATALVRGKWNLSEYPTELGEILKEYNIDYTKRGKY